MWRVAPLVFWAPVGPAARELSAPCVVACGSAGVPGVGGPGRCVCRWARPPASRPRRELRSARRLEARPGPATAHRHRGRSLRRPSHRRRLVCSWAAARPRAFGSARRLEAWPGPAAAHRHRSQALRSLRRPPCQWGLVCWRVVRCVDSLSGQAPPPPTGTAARPSGPSGALHTGGAWCTDAWLARCPEARLGPEAVLAISHVIPLRSFQTMNSYRWGFNVSAVY